MIARPINDHDCLGPTTDQIIAAIAARDPALVDLAHQFQTTDDLAVWFRSLPQRDDDGDPAEGPKVHACRPAQRLQLESLEPNCFERASRYIGAAELIDPDRVYRLATASTPHGLHTFPLRDGEPVILDPLASASGLSDTRNSAVSELGVGSLTLTPAQAIDWIAKLAMVRANLIPAGIRRVEAGRRAMRGVLVLRPICVGDIRDVVLALALAEREASVVGLGLLKVVHSTARAIDALDRVAARHVTMPPRNSSLASLAAEALGSKELQSLVGSLARVAGRIAGGVGLEAARVKLGKIGVGVPVLRAFEAELNREGLTLGALARPAPIVGSLDAMTPQALAGRWLGEKL
ncbi:MAG: hypothetical protein KIT31_05265 [Deltaproteobacteria bacterium]|nr:hypothetical protein [Deltaproteobacteria bacterium]